MTAKETIQQGKAILGIEFGSTRIKAVLIDGENKPIAQGSHEWENQLVDGLWTYSTEAIWYGLQDCYADLRKNVLAEYDIEIEKLAAIGIRVATSGKTSLLTDSGPTVPRPFGMAYRTAMPTFARTCLPSMTSRLRNLPLLASVP